MSFREHLKTMFMDFFLITTLVNFAVFILGSIYKNGNLFSYEILLLPPLYGLFGTLPNLILYSKKELTMKKLIIRKVFQVITLEILLILLTFQGENLCLENINIIISFSISVLVIYFLVVFISWILDNKTAKEMMIDLENYQK